MVTWLVITSPLQDNFTQKELFDNTFIIGNNKIYIALYRKIYSVVQWSENVMLNVFATKSAIKEGHHSKCHHQMVFHTTVPSNIVNDMTRMSLGTLGIKFRDSKMFIHRNRLNRHMSHKLEYTNQTILYAFDIYQKRFLIE